MPCLPVCRFPHPVLTKAADPVIKFDRAVGGLVQDLIDTMYASPGTIGLAAPQIGISKRIFVCDVSKKDSSTQLRIFINPEISKWADPRSNREGCLSLPDYTGNVTRAQQVFIRAADENGKVFECHANGIEAICWQHELDHLNGLLFIHRVTNIKTDVFRRKRYLS
ncbi:MAG: peptide deformylase [Candidatus Omnitrophica bacterium]|nr:peptide deformylase [Candidatus Omnitrophota bacterium]